MRDGVSPKSVAGGSRRRASRVAGSPSKRPKCCGDVTITPHTSSADAAFTSDAWVMLPCVDALERRVGEVAGRCRGPTRHTRPGSSLMHERVRREALAGACTSAASWPV